MRLTTDDHDRGAAGLTYVYPVVSRRAGGVSVGVNLNPNSACNFRCVYCQVPGLTRGVAPEIDLALLERELDGLVGAIVERGWLERHAPEGARVLKDVAISGNGEPTSSRQFALVVALVGRVLARHDLVGRVKLVLITNGTYVQRPEVQRGLAGVRELAGEVWFKLDGATDAELARLNDYHGGVARLRRNLALAAKLCPTWVQTMALALDGEPPAAEERAAYDRLLAELVAEGVPLEGVLLYGLARPSHQPEAPRLSALEPAWLAERGRAIARATGLVVRVSP